MYFYLFAREPLQFKSPISLQKHDIVIDSDTSKAYECLRLNIVSQLVDCLRVQWMSVFLFLHVLTEVLKGSHNVLSSNESYS